METFMQLRCVLGIEFRDRFASLIGCRVRIAQRHADCAVTQKITHCV
jgi:hypothetical protein